MKRKKLNKKNRVASSVLQQVKAARKQSREEEINQHGKTLNFGKIIETKKIYNRKKSKADDEVLPYLFYYNLYFNPTQKFVPGCERPPKSA